MIYKPWFVSLWFCFVVYLIFQKDGFRALAQRRHSSDGVFLPGHALKGDKNFTNTQTKGSVCEAECVWIHLQRAEQACWQGNTSGEGQPSTLWLRWRQWHNSNTCRVHSSSFLNLLSLSVNGSSQNPAWSWMQKQIRKKTGDFSPACLIFLSNLMGWVLIFIGSK